VPIWIAMSYFSLVLLVYTLILAVARYPALMQRGYVFTKKIISLLNVFTLPIHIKGLLLKA
jgi:hypothetical protein